MLSGVLIQTETDKQNEEVRSQAIDSVENCLPTLLFYQKKEGEGSTTRRHDISLRYGSIV